MNEFLMLNEMINALDKHFFFCKNQKLIKNKLNNNNNET